MSFLLLLFAVNTRNVLSLYQAIPEDFFQCKYRIEGEGDSWSASPVSEESEEYYTGCTIDFKNGYIAISDEGTGGGSRFIQEVVLFLSQKGVPYIGINEYWVDYLDSTGVGVITVVAWVSLKFLRYGDDKFTDVTSDIFPEIHLLDFFPEDEHEKLKNLGTIFEEGEALFHFTLPRIGTTAEAVLNLNRLKRIAPDLAVEVKKERIPISWDRIKARFRLIAGD